MHVFARMRTSVYGFARMRARVCVQVCAHARGCVCGVVRAGYGDVNCWSLRPGYEDMSCVSYWKYDTSNMKTLHSNASSYLDDKKLQHKLSISFALRAYNI